MKNLKAIFVISLAFVSLILITAIVSMRTEVLEEREIAADGEVVKILKNGEAAQLSAYLAPDVNFFIPGLSRSTDGAEASKLIENFFSKHPVLGFEKESVLPGNSPGLSYLKGTLHTKGKDFTLYATIYRGKVERLDLNAVD